MWTHYSAVTRLNLLGAKDSISQGSGKIVAHHGYKRRRKFCDFKPPKQP